ncbi:MAG: hypothetical protein IJ460_06380 [Clostridia bacterium]|nr:hypothetical protein [Clostridia bacterium]
MDFKNVPKNYRPIPFWSWNEKLDTKETVRQIEEMDNAGIGGFFMHARGGLQTEYMGEEWFENVEACASKCEENGMHAWAYDENGWPSGFGSGMVNGLGIEYQQKYLRVEEGEGSGEHTIANVDGYHFYYDVNPYYVDTLDGKVIKVFIEKIYDEYYKRFKNRIDGFFTDEPQISRNGIPWSFIMPEEYEKAYGENLIQHLPELFFDIKDYKKTRVKFWKMVTDLFSKNYMKQIYDWCTERGLGYTGHLVLEENFYSQIVSNGACMPHYEYMTIPGMDWLGRHNHRSLTPYQVGSVARQMGQKQVLSETYAMCGHNVGHDELKWIFEYQMVRGINLLCQHLEGYSNRGLRKRDYPPAMFIQQPWWKDYRMFNDAMSRIGMLLTEGDDGVDVLVIHPMTTAWTMYNNNMPKYVNEAKKDCSSEIHEYSMEFLDLLLALERKHINFHLGDETMMERHGRVEGSSLVIGKKKYSKIIIPRHEVFFDNTEKLLTEFKANGGIITTVDEIETNDIIDIPEITYCARYCDDYDMYYFVNSTEDTFRAKIKVGTKIMDPVTGELYPFDGTYTFNKYASLVVIDDRTERATAAPEKEIKAIDLGGKWDIEKVTENIITLDYCDYYFDGVLEEKNGYILNAMYRAIDLGRPVNITCEFGFEVAYIPERLYLACEMPENLDISVNGEKIEKTDCGYFADKSFRKLDIARYVKLGENKIVVNIDFTQSDEVYANIEKSKVFESEKNKLTFDIEIEQMYLIGDFSVSTDGSFEELDRDVSRYTGKFVISEPVKSISLTKIERQGFPFFAGDITVKKTFAKDGDMMLDFVKTGINVVKARINGKEIRQFMWEPYTADVSDLLVDGDNEIELTLVNNLRNMQGPFHLSEGEDYACRPGSFYKEDCLWVRGFGEDRWNDNYCFANVSITNR